jgi:hypothetical protein
VVADKALRANPDCLQSSRADHQNVNCFYKLIDLVFRQFCYIFLRPVGLVAQLVEQCPFNSKSPILAIFIRFYLPFTIIAEPLISLAEYDVLLLSLVLSPNPIVFIRVTSRVQVFLWHLNRVDS